MRALRSQRGFVQALAVIPKPRSAQTPTQPGSTLACGATNGKVRLWDHHRGKQLRAWEAERRVAIPDSAPRRSKRRCWSACSTTLPSTF